MIVYSTTIAMANVIAVGIVVVEGADHRGFNRFRVHDFAQLLRIT
jgi:hypothetical protein